MSHPLVLTMTNSTTGRPISGRTVQLTTSPINRTGHKRRAITDGSGRVTFQIANSLRETVVYTGTLVAKNARGLTAVQSNSVTILWGGTVDSTTNTNISYTNVVDASGDGFVVLYYSVTWTENVVSGGVTYQTSRGHSHYYVSNEPIGLGTPPESTETHTVVVDVLEFPISAETIVSTSDELQSEMLAYVDDLQA